MTEIVGSIEIPIPEQILRDLPKDLQTLGRVIPNFAEKERTIGVKEFQDLVGPILETADLADLSPSHRAAACNALCAIIENVQTSDVEYARSSALDDFIWFRLFQIYLQRSDNAKGKSMRQMLVVLTGVLLKSHSPDSLRLKDRSASILINIICQRHDRLKVKPALQGLAHFLQKGVISLPQLIEIYRKSLLETTSILSTESELARLLFGSVLAWIVHHDTSLSAGHLIKIYLAQLRQSSHYETPNTNDSVLPLWIEPVISALHLWPDRIQEFKTHVFPHCFLPNIDEYLQFLSCLHFDRHVATRGPLLSQFQRHKGCQNDMDDFEEFKVLLATIQTGKELGILKDVERRQCNMIEVHGNTIHLPDDIFGDWLSHCEPEVRLAGLFSSVHSTSVTRPVTDGVFESLKQHLLHLHTDGDANFRREVLGHTQKLFDRLRGSMSTLARLRPKDVLSSHAGVPQFILRSRYGRHMHMLSSQEPLTKTMDFIVWYIRFLEWELRSTSSYQRRITALRALTIVLRSGLDPRISHSCLSRSAQGQLHWPYGFQICNARTIRTLLDLLLDPYDDVRNTSASILELCLDSFVAEERSSVLLTLPPFISRAESAMLRTGRADQADGLARAYSLLFSQCTERSGDARKSDDLGLVTRSGIFGRLVEQLEETINVARNDMSLAVEGRPVHGIFAALRYIIDQEKFYPSLDALSVTQFDEWKKMYTQICALYEALWTCIRDVLCADAPEGHIPEEMEEETSIDTKEILSYSWRGLKEASILLRTMISKAPIGTHEYSLIDQRTFETLGKLCFTQLVDLRHRGAFSTVAQTFAAFCRRCLSTNDELLQELPEKWYQETLLSIHEKADSITRRSAGIPALMSSIIAAESHPGSGSLFSRAMKDLIAEASQDAQDSNIEESRLPQVHALNCIKEIFMTSKLSAASEPYLGECLNLAAKSLNSKIWPIRNCSLVLFKALIERLLGSDEAQDWKERDRTKTSRFSYQNYPGLVQILSDLLNPNGPLKQSMETTIEGGSPLDLHGAEGVFPALQILRQAPPPEPDRGDILKSVHNLVNSPHWHLRDMAARTLVSLYYAHDDFNTITKLLASIEGSTNSQHGLLLALKYIVRRFLRNSQDSTSGAHNTLNALILVLTENSATLFVKTKCPFTRSSFIDLINLCGMAILQQTQRYESLPGEWGKLTEDWESLTDSLGTIGQLGEVAASDSALFRGSTTQWRAINQAITAYRPGPALARLAKVDPDSCSNLLSTLAEIMDTKDRTDPAYTTVLLAQIHLHTLNGQDEEVVSKAQAVLAGSLFDQERRLGFFNNVKENDVISSLEMLETQCLEGSPSSMQSALHLLGYFLDFAYHSYPSHRRTVLQRITRYIRLLRRTIDEENPFDSRYAGARSLCALFHIWTLPSSSKSTSSLILGLSIILYDLLNDDDDEIRDAAAVATTRLLLTQSLNPDIVSLDPSTTINPVVPILTTHRLAKYLTTHFRTSSALTAEALRRLTGAASISALFSSPFADTLAEARRENNALFVIEKRNLFKDDTLDTALWSRVLRCMTPHAVPPHYISGLRTWVLDGFAALTEIARREGDGALGWTSKAEVFTLGMRVTCAAEVVLAWKVEGVETGSVRRALRELADVRCGEGVHGLWVEKIEAVLEREVLEGLRRVYESLSAM